MHQRLGKKFHATHPWRELSLKSPMVHGLRASRRWSGKYCIFKGHENLKHAVQGLGRAFAHYNRHPAYKAPTPAYNVPVDRDAVALLKDDSLSSRVLERAYICRAPHVTSLDPRGCKTWGANTLCDEET